MDKIDCNFMDIPYFLKGVKKCYFLKNIAYMSVNLFYPHFTYGRLW